MLRFVNNGTFAPYPYFEERSGGVGSAHPRHRADANAQAVAHLADMPAAEPQESFI